MIKFAWIIPLFPLVAFLLLMIGRRKLSEGAAASIGVAGVLASLSLSVAVFLERLQSPSNYVATFDWLRIDQVMVTMGIEVDALGTLMLLVVSLVSFLVFVYARGYMRGDQRFSTFYAYLSLFAFAMLSLVLSPNLLQIYLFWELVGVGSFLLIGFWTFKPEAKAAAKKAFVVTRIGDVAFFVAILLTFWKVGSLELSQVFAAVESGQLAPEIVTTIAILIFIGAVGKSGQFPLHTWLPDAMEGPTPVSALIHAATMVAAGVYLVARTYPLFLASPIAMDVVAYVGVFTAIFAATIALVQNDIKRVLAYSTVSQLGYMMFALGSAGYVAGIFHLTTHAFFKALLFLAAGAVIVSCQRQQDIRQMGGLWAKNRTVGSLFLIGALAIAGVPPLSGFFSKDAILLAAYQDGRYIVFLVGVLAAFLTAFYVFRLFFLIFGGSYRGKEPVVSVPKVMVWPMIILAVFAVATGFVNFPTDAFANWLVEGNGIAAQTASTPWWLPVGMTILSIIGIAMAWILYGKRSVAVSSFGEPGPLPYRLLARKYYVDEIYDRVFVRSLKGLGLILQAFDRFIIEGLVKGIAGIISWLGRIGSRLQNGQAQSYVLVSLIGLILLVVSFTAGRLLK